MCTSMALIASPSRITTRCTPRTSRAFAAIPSRPAAPTRAIADSFPGQVISSAAERPGIGERAVGEEGAAPDGGELVAGSGGELVRESADRPAAGIQQSGLSRQRLPRRRARAPGSGWCGGFRTPRSPRSRCARRTARRGPCALAWPVARCPVPTRRRFGPRSGAGRPENLRMVASSAARTAVLLISMRASSSLTSAVSANRGSLIAVNGHGYGSRGAGSLAAEVAVLHADGHARLVP